MLLSDQGSIVAAMTLFVVEVSSGQPVDFIITMQPSAYTMNKIR